MNLNNITMHENMCETISKIEYLTGISINSLLDLLAAGWTLTPPKEQKVSDIL